MNTNPTQQADTITADTPEETAEHILTALTILTRICAHDVAPQHPESSWAICEARRTLIKIRSSILSTVEADPCDECDRDRCDRNVCPCCAAEWRDHDGGACPNGCDDEEQRRMEKGGGNE